MKGAARGSSAFASHRADVGVVVAYGLILPEPSSTRPAHGCLNLHASALPRWRGAAPIQRAIMAGDAETAATVMRMDGGLDTGPVCLVERVPIEPDTTAGELHDLLADRGAELMVRALGRARAGTLDCTPQPAEGVTYAAKIDKAETRIDFTQAVTRRPQPRARAVADARRLVRGQPRGPDGTRSSCCARRSSSARRSTAGTRPAMMP